MLKVHRPLLLGSIGVLLGLGIVLTVIVISGSEIPRTMLPVFLIWLLLVCLQTGFWTIVFWPLWKALKELWIHPKEQLAQLGLPAGAIIILLTFQSVVIQWLFPSDLNPPFEQFYISLLIITGVGSVLGIMGTWVILLIGYKIEHDSKDTDRAQEAYDSHVRLRENLNWSVLVLGTIIGLATLGAGAIRNMYIHNNKGIEDIYPPEFVLIYGAFYAVILGLVVVPTYASLFAAGTKIRDSKLPAPPIDSDSWSDIHNRRKQFDEVFQLSFNYSHNLKAGIAVLSPFIGSIISILIA